MFVLNTVCVT